MAIPARVVWKQLYDSHMDTYVHPYMLTYSFPQVTPKHTIESKVLLLPSRSCSIPASSLADVAGRCGPRWCSPADTNSGGVGAVAVVVARMPCTSNQVTETTHTSGFTHQGSACRWPYVCPPLIHIDHAQSPHKTLKLHAITLTKPLMDPITHLCISCSQL